MKKEFKAPIIESKQLTAMDGVMADHVMFTSAGQNPDGLAQLSDSAASGYEQWKGFKAE